MGHMSGPYRDPESYETTQLDLSGTFQKSAEVVDSQPSSAFELPPVMTLNGPIEQEPSPT